MTFPMKFAAVQKVGFGIAPVVSAKKQSAIDAERRRLDIKKRRSNLILAAVFAIPLFYISMGHMVGFLSPRSSPNRGLSPLRR